MKPYFSVKIERVEEVPETKREYKQVADSGNPRDGGVQYEYVTFEGTSYERTNVLEIRMTDTELDRARIVQAVALVLGVNP